MLGGGRDEGEEDAGDAGRAGEGRESGREGDEMSCLHCDGELEDGRMGSSIEKVYFACRMS